MILLPRVLVRDIAAVFKRTFGPTVSRDLWVRLTATEEALTIRAATNDIAIEHRLSGHYEPLQVLVPLEVLRACGSNDRSAVTFTMQSDGTARVTWEDRGVPWQRDGGVPGKNLPEFPLAATEIATNEPGLLRALNDARDTTDSHSSRYALGCIQLRGEGGELAATDGKQVLVQTGYRFPWSGVVLVAASKFFASRELPPDQAIQIGKADQFVSFNVGPWTLWLRQTTGDSRRWKIVYGPSIKRGRNSKSIPRMRCSPWTPSNACLGPTP